MRIKEIIKTLGVFTSNAPIKDFEVKGISCNSKKTAENFVFVAIKGESEDGNAFIKEAIKRGARAVVIESAPSSKLIAHSKIPFMQVKDTRLALARLAAEFYDNPSEKIKVVGITGTNGKTTVTYLLEAILAKAHLSCGVIGTVNYRFKNKVIPAKNTTPGPLDLQSMLADMRKAGINYCLMEVSSHALAQKRTEEINFHSAIFTNLTQDHLDYHKTQENYFQSKAKLFKNLQKNSFAVINADDKYGRRIAKLSKVKTISYGIKNNAQLTAKNIRFDCAHTEFLLCEPKIKTTLKARVIGKHNVYNILASCAWALQAGIPLSAIKSALREFQLVPGRLERIETDRDFSVFVDYAHTEDALKNIINSLRRVSIGRVIVVFGCGGDRDKTKRPKMGKVATELADFAIITNDNPRSEKPEVIICDIRKGIKGKNFCLIPDRRKAIEKALSLAKSKDIVLVAGKGHESYQILGSKIVHFDDREVVRECLKSAN